MDIVKTIITGAVGVGIVSAGAWALDTTTRNDQGQIVEAGDLGVFSFKVGDCLTDIPETAAEFSKARGVPCTEPHQWEVYSETFLENLEVMPADLGTQADDYCLGEFPFFVGVTYDKSLLEIMSMLPTTASWAEGDREISCLIAEPNGMTSSQSLKGVGR